MDVCLGYFSGYRLGESRGKIGNEYCNVGYSTLISDLPKSQPIHKLILSLTVSINYLSATHFFQCMCRDSASRGKRRLGRNC